MAIELQENRWYLLTTEHTGAVRCKDIEKHFERMDKEDALDMTEELNGLEEVYKDSDPYFAKEELYKRKELNELEKVHMNSDYYFTEEEMLPKIKEGQEIGISKFEETFVKIDEEFVKKLCPSSIITSDMKEEPKIKNIMKETILKYCSKDENINNEIKKSIEEKIAELENRKEKIKIAKEESRKQAEEESRRQAEEESRRQAEEESIKQAEEESTKISEEQARELAVQIYGTNLSYFLEAMVKDSSGLEYYLFRMTWLVNNSHFSTVGGIAVSVDGKKWKEVDIYYQNYKNGQTIEEVYKEGDF